MTVAQHAIQEDCHALQTMVGHISEEYRLKLAVMLSPWHELTPEFRCLH